MWGRTPGERILDFLLPRTCAACREDLPAPLTGPLCGPCLDRLSRRRPGPLADRPPPGISVLRAAFDYRPPVPGLVHAFKYRGRLSVGRALGDWMAGAWARYPELSSAALLIPVPLHPRRFRERGFNQAAVLAERLSRGSGVPVGDALARVRASGPRARTRPGDRASLSGAFRAADRAAVRGKRVVVIDDVKTTGGTLAGCARALRRVGAADVAAFVFATAAPGFPVRPSKVFLTKRIFAMFPRRSLAENGKDRENPTAL